MEYLNEKLRHLKHHRTSDYTDINVIEEGQLYAMTKSHSTSWNNDDVLDILVYLGRTAKNSRVFKLYSYKENSFIYILWSDYNNEWKFVNTSDKFFKLSVFEDVNLLRDAYRINFLSDLLKEDLMQKDIVSITDTEITLSTASSPVNSTYRFGTDITADFGYGEVRFIYNPEDFALTYKCYTDKIIF